MAVLTPPTPTPAPQTPSSADPKASTSPAPKEGIVARRDLLVALLALVGILTNLPLHYVFHASPFTADLPLLVVLVLGGGVLCVDLLIRVFHGRFGSDLLAGISIVASICMHQYMAGSL